MVYLSDAGLSWSERSGLGAVGGGGLMYLLGAFWVGFGEFVGCFFHKRVGRGWWWMCEVVVTIKCVRHAILLSPLALGFWEVSGHKPREEIGRRGEALQNTQELEH